MPKFNVTLRRNLHGINSTQEIEVVATDGDAAFLVAAAEVQADFPTATCDHISTTPIAPAKEKKKTATVPKNKKGAKNG